MHIPFFGNAARRLPSAPHPGALTGISGSIALYTETGPMAAMHLAPGDRVLRRGRGGPVVVRAVEVTQHAGPMIRIAPGALGRARPEEFTLLPPDQRVLVRAAAGADRDGVFAARDLVDGRDVRWHDPETAVPLVHLSLGSIEILHAGGLELEIAG